MKIASAFVIAVALTLGSCASTGTVLTNVQSAVTQVRQGVDKACGFLINTQTTNVEAILAALLPSAASIEGAVVSAIQAICTAVAPAKVKKLALPPTVNGVVIHGRFIR